MIRVDEPSIHDAVGAVVPIGAVKALVTDAPHILVTAIADSIVLLVPPWSKQR